MTVQEQPCVYAASEGYLPTACLIWPRGFIWWHLRFEGSVGIVPPFPASLYLIIYFPFTRVISPIADSSFTVQSVLSQRHMVSVMKC